MVAPSKAKTGACKSCSTAIRADNRSGYCGRCVKKTPEFRAKAAAGAQRRYADPAARERTGAAMRAAYQRDPTIAERKAAKMREIAADPEWKARNAEQCRERRLWETGLAARTPESHARQGRTFSQRHGLGAWCPADYVDLARDLRRSGVPLDETKRLVAEQQEADRAAVRKRHAAARKRTENETVRRDLQRLAMGLAE